MGKKWHRSSLGHRTWGNISKALAFVLDIPTYLAVLSSSADWSSDRWKGHQGQGEKLKRHCEDACLWKLCERMWFDETSEKDKVASVDIYNV